MTRHHLVLNTFPPLSRYPVVTHFLGALHMCLACSDLFRSLHMKFYPLHTPGPVLQEPCSSFQTQFIRKSLCEDLLSCPKQLVSPTCVPTTCTFTLYGNWLWLPCLRACLSTALAATTFPTGKKSSSISGDTR